MIVKALKELGYISYKWRVSGEEIYDNLIWEDERPKPSRSELQTEIDKLQAEYDTQNYARNRKKEYPSAADQLDMLFHDMTTGKGTKSGAWYTAIAKVKSDNPKK